MYTLQVSGLHEGGEEFITLSGAVGYTARKRAVSQSSQVAHHNNFLPTTLFQKFLCTLCSSLEVHNLRTLLFLAVMFVNNEQSLVLGCAHCIGTISPRLATTNKHLVVLCSIGIIIPCTAINTMR